MHTVSWYISGVIAPVIYTHIRPMRSHSTNVQGKVVPVHVINAYRESRCTTLLFF